MYKYFIVRKKEKLKMNYLLRRRRWATTPEDRNRRERSFSWTSRSNKYRPICHQVLVLFVLAVLEPVHLDFDPSFPRPYCAVQILVFRDTRPSKNRPHPFRQ